MYYPSFQNRADYENQLLRIRRVIDTLSNPAAKLALQRFHDKVEKEAIAHFPISTYAIEFQDNGTWVKSQARKLMGYNAAVRALRYMAKKNVPCRLVADQDI